MIHCNQTVQVLPRIMRQVEQSLPNAISSNPPATKPDYRLLAFPSLALALLVGLLETMIYRQTGHIVYPLDDPYIHMAMARHLAEHEIFGVSLAGFSASSSSPLWTLLVAACFKVLGNREIIPVLINLLVGSILTFHLAVMLFQTTRSHRMSLSITWFMIFLLPLPTLICLGMEHTLHIWLVLIWIERAVRVLTGESIERHGAALFILGVLATLTRYETGFVAVPLLFLFMMKRQWFGCLSIFLACGIPIVTVGIIQMFMGWDFFPSSFTSKSALVASGWGFWDQVAKRIYGQLFGTPHLTLPFILSFTAIGHQIANQRGPGSHSAGSIWNFTFIVSSILHCSFASTGWFYRYEAYLLGMAVVSLSVIAIPAGELFRLAWNRWNNAWEKTWARAMILALVCFTLVPLNKNLFSIQNIVPGAYNIYSQQYQMGLFLSEYYPSETIAANDIGAINFLADIECLDLMALGSYEPRLANRQNQWGPRFLDNWATARNASIAILYESWYRDVIPPTWIKIGEWKVDRKLTVADSTVAFFAIGPGQADRLHNNLVDFEPRMPAGTTLTLVKKHSQ